MAKAWAYGVTTVPSRLHTLLPQTLNSLAKAGFPYPRLFIDGDCTPPPTYQVTQRIPPVRTAGNWVLSALELTIREPGADYYALFQDDIQCSKHIREYLEQCEYPKNGYLNLYTVPSNEKTKTGWFASNQRGKGALALVFSNEAMCVLLSQRYLIDRPKDPIRGHKAIDGGIVDAMRKAGWCEWVHNPSLVQHVGVESSMGNTWKAPATTFRGEEFDALELVK